MTHQFESMTGLSAHTGMSRAPNGPDSPGPLLYVQQVLLPGGLRDRMHPVAETGGMAARLLERPIDEVLDVGEDERLCDSKTVDDAARPFRVISQCSKPAEWIYVMRCCGGHTLACDPCHEHHLRPPIYQRYCVHCSHPLSTLADGARAVYRV